jgi:mono/diheme cytochrome c family protein
MRACFVAALCLSASACGAKVDYATIPGEALYRVRCASCHGVSGAGDGPAAANLQPQPRNLSDAAWQAGVTDAHLAAVITGGGAAVGKSALMPPQPDLAAHPQALQRLVAFVRGLAQPATRTTTAQGTPVQRAPSSNALPQPSDRH